MVDKKQNRLKILIVDDNQVNRDMIRDLLENEYEIDETENGADAIDKMEKHHDEYALVLMDILLPVMSGLDALEVMNRCNWTDSVPVVIMSSEDPSKHMSRAYEMGASDYLALPQDLVFLRRRLENNIRHYAYLRHKLAKQRRINTGDRKERYDKAGIIRHMRAMMPYYSVVRLVDVNSMIQYNLTEDGELAKGEFHCYEVWKRTGRCENCISCKAIEGNAKNSKFEFIGCDAYYIISRPVVVDDKDYALELISPVENNSLIHLMDQDETSDALREYNRKLYTDPLTGAYNRNYVKEQLAYSDLSAVCMIDIDLFKTVNDDYGHDAGDQALKTAAYVIMSQIRRTDTLVRYGGDEFLLAFSGIPEDILVKRLEKIRRMVEDYRLKDYPDLRITLSIGGVLSKNCSDETIKRADECLYKAKISRNNVVFAE